MDKKIEISKIFNNFIDKFPIIKYKKGDRVKDPFESLSNLVYIRSGILKIFTVTKKGEEVIISYFNPCAYPEIIFGISTPFINQYFIEALTEVEIQQISKSDFAKITKRYPEIYLQLSRNLLVVIRGLFEQVKYLKIGNSYSKILTAIFYLTSTCGKLINNSATISFRITHQMIADFTGLTRETVTTQLNNLEKKGLIEFKKGSLTIKDFKKYADLVKEVQ